MFFGADIDDYLKPTPISHDEEQPSIWYEENTGEPVNPKVFDQIATPKLRNMTKRLFKVITTIKVYGELVTCIDKLMKRYPTQLYDFQHAVIETEDGFLNVMLTVHVADPTPENKVALIFSTAFRILLGPDQDSLIDMVYEDEDVNEVNKLTKCCFAITNSIYLICREGNIQDGTPGSKTVEGLLKVRSQFDQERWAGIRSELYYGVTPIIIKKRWGVINSKDFKNGTDEEAIFNDLFNRLYNRRGC